MSNYNERLEEIFAPLIDSPSLTLTTTYWDEAKADLTSLIKELIAEAKPEEYVHYYATDPVDGGRKIGYDEAVREFEQNLLKALEEISYDTDR